VVEDPKLLELFRLGIGQARSYTPKTFKTAVGRFATDTITVIDDKDQEYHFLLFLSPSYDTEPDQKNSDFMIEGFGFQGLIQGGLNRVHSPAWAMFLNEVFAQNNKPKLSEHAFNKLSGKYWLENSLNEAEEILKKNAEAKPK